MTYRERFRAALRGECPACLPAIEWASWWDKTVDAWRAEDPAMPADNGMLWQYLGLDPHHQYWIGTKAPGCPEPAAFGHGLLSDAAGYEALRPYLFPVQAQDAAVAWARSIRPMLEAGETVAWLTLDGFFWFPRTLFGIQDHLYAFYDEPALMHRMNQDLVDFYLPILEAVYREITPDFMTFAEDMSYKNGPMISPKLFVEFLRPYYRQVIPFLREHGTTVLVDTDGNMESMIPLLREAGIQGNLPLERQALVDVARIREQHPDWIMIGGFDKTVMHRGEEAMRREFERLLPTMRTGGYIPSVDHQTPPDVSLENYHTYVRLLREYTQKAAATAG